MLTVIVFSLLLSSQAAGVKVGTCCPPDQLLDLSRPDLPRCVRSDEGEVRARPGPEQDIGRLCLFEYEGQELLVR